jgi:hypothetical protein
MTTMLHPQATALQTTRGPAPKAAGMSLQKLLRALRRSRALASMLPAFVLSGVITCLTSAIMLVTMDAAVAAAPVGYWMEAWLTSWPIAFPVAYLLGPALLRVSMRHSAAPAPRASGLGIRDAVRASDRVTARHGLTVLRPVKTDNYAA